jgi:glucose/arabinose dehydrogenase
MRRIPWNFACMFLALSVFLAACAPQEGTPHGFEAEGAAVRTPASGLPAIQPTPTVEQPPTPGLREREATPLPAEPVSTASPTPAGPPAATPPPTPTPEPTPQIEPTNGTASDPVSGEPFLARVDLELVAEGLVAPLALVSSPDGSGRLFIADMIGLVHVLTPQGELLEQPFLDLRSRMVSLNPSYDERGLLGLAFHPQFAENGRFFVYYSAPLRPGAPAGWNHTSHISEFRVSAEDPDRAYENSERILLQVDQPQSNHNAGQIAFGPADGYLYIPLGDGGGANDTGAGHPPQGHGQDTTTLLGSILRIDVNQGDPYSIPPDNPFVGQAGLDEIYAYGLRNPYKISFDAAGEHELFAADAGQNLWEEVNIIQPGGNYGWNVREGRHCFDPANPNRIPQNCPETGPAGEPLAAPAIEYPNARNPENGLGLVVIGGYVYRGSSLPELRGRYIFGDWSTSSGAGRGILMAATRPAQGGLWEITRLEIGGQADLGHYLLSFGEDEDHELYVLTTDSPGPSGRTGRVYRLVAPEG